MLNVQIIDDEPIIRKGLEKLINWEELGFEIACMAQNGKEALEQWETEKIDLIIVDIQMPVMDGLNFIKEVREKEVVNMLLTIRELIEVKKNQVLIILGLVLINLIRAYFMLLEV